MKKRVDLITMILLAAAVIPVIVLIYTLFISRYSGSIVTALSDLFKF